MSKKNYKQAMAAAQCFFCKKFVQCDDHRAHCDKYEAKNAKVSKRGNSIKVTFEQHMSIT